MPARKKKKEITLDEFKAWLEGVEELQPTGWAPDPSQWKLIRNKIECIVEAKPSETFSFSEASIPRQPAPTTSVSDQTPPPHTPHHPLPAAPAAPLKSAFDGLVETKIGPPTPMAPTAPANVPLAPGPDGKTHTPNIDTSDGSFKSSFE